MTACRDEQDDGNKSPSVTQHDNHAQQGVLCSSFSSSGIADNIQ